MAPCAIMSAGSTKMYRQLHLSLLLIGIFVLHLPATMGVTKHKYFDLMTKCHSYSLHRIEGAVVILGGQPKGKHHHTSCDISFQTISVLQKLQLQFRLLQLHCGDRLLVYDAGMASKYLPPQANLTCDSNAEDVGVLTTQTNFVTLRYLPVATEEWRSNMTLIITAIKGPKYACDEFRCTTSELCVSETVTCDGVKNCEDGSDESSELCPPSSMVDTGSSGKGPYAYEGKTYYVDSGEDTADCRRMSLSLLLPTVTLLTFQEEEVLHLFPQLYIFLLLGFLQSWWIVITAVSAVIIFLAVVFIVKSVCCK